MSYSDQRVMNGAREIVYLSSVDISLPNGPGVNEREFIVELQGQFDDRLHVIIPKPRHSVPEIEAVKVTFVPPRRRGLMPLLACQASLYSAFRKFARAHSIDLLVLRLPFLPFAAYAISRRHEVPFVIKTVGTGALDGLRRNGASGFLARPLNLLNARLVDSIMARTLGVDACTPQLVERVIARWHLPPGRVKWIENATNTDRFVPADGAEAKREIGISFGRVVGYIGGSPSERGAAMLVEAAPELIKRYPDIGFLVVGHDSGLAAVQRRASELGVDRHFVFTGSVPYSDVPRYAQALDVGVAFDKAIRVNTVGNSYQKVRQYISVGIPVVTNEGTSLPLEEMSLGSTVSSVEPASVAQAIAAWLDMTEEERCAHAERAHSYAKSELSVAKALRDRVAFWSALIGASARVQTETETAVNG